MQLPLSPCRTDKVLKGGLMRFKLILCSFKFACLIDMSCCIIWVSSPLTGKALLNKTFNQMEQDLADELRFNMLLKSDPCKVSSVHCTIWGLWYWMSVSHHPLIWKWLYRGKREHDPLELLVWIAWCWMNSAIGVWGQQMKTCFHLREQLMPHCL